MKTALKSQQRLDRNLPCYYTLLTKTTQDYLQIHGGLNRVEGAIEIEMNAGDALLFVDCLAHGSASRMSVLDPAEVRPEVENL